MMILNGFGYKTVQILFIKEDIYDFCKKNKLFLIPFNKKNYKYILDILYTATYYDQKFKIGVGGRSWEEKIKEFDKVGKPDFFIFKFCYDIKRIECYFVEYKTINDSLKPRQIKWFKKYHKLPLMIIYTTKNKWLSKGFKKEDWQRMLLIKFRMNNFI